MVDVRNTFKSAKSHGLNIAIAIFTFGGFSVLPAAFAPIIQILLMIAIIRAGHWIRRLVHRPGNDSEDLFDEPKYVEE
ncbi:MAG: hypothetical protein ACTSSE_09560 [Candidatus Thorarchaeota archaeon]